MTKMKRSEFKAMVKECVRECIREIMQEQINPTGLLESLVPDAPRAPAAYAPAVINPMDDYQMRIRQELVSQRAMQGQLQRQTTMHAANPLKQPVVGLSELAGLDDSRPINYREANDSSPADRLKYVDRRAERGFNSYLDTPIGGQQRQPPARQPMTLDPALDTPLGGGPMRAPDPSVLRDIFEDTARTTYQIQAANGHTQPSHLSGDVGAMPGAISAPADRAAAIVAQSNPEDLFVGSQNWAMLAFR